MRHGLAVVMEIPIEGAANPAVDVKGVESIATVCHGPAPIAAVVNADLAKPSFPFVHLSRDFSSHSRDRPRTARIGGSAKASALRLEPWPSPCVTGLVPVQKHSPAELESFLRAALADAPYDLKAHGAWLFAYGSMLEDPPFDAMKRTTGVLQGFARRFCLTDPVLRGDEAIPGLTLGLAPGGACQGVLWRLAPERAEDDLRRFWPQEMQLPLYRPTWRPVAADEGAVRALVLLADTSGPLFQPPLAEGAVVERIARARGEKGANADYLFETAAALTRAGIPDAYLDRLASAVKRAQREPQES